MAAVVTVRRLWEAELCPDESSCRHANCRRARDLRDSPCIYCARPIGSPFVWTADLRTTAMIAKDVWYAGFAHLRCYERAVVREIIPVPVPEPVVYKRTPTPKTRRALTKRIYRP